MEDIINNLLSILKSNNGKRNGGKIISVNKLSLGISSNSDLRISINSNIKNKISDLNYYYLPDKSSADELSFLDLTRGFEVYTNKINIIGYLYEDGNVVPYIIDTIDTSKNA